MFIGMADNDLIGVDHAETSGFDVLFLTEGEQNIEKFFIRLQHFYKFHNSSIGDIQLTIEAISAGITFNSHFTNCGKIDTSNKFADILAVVLDKSVGHKGMRSWYKQVIDRLNTCCTYLTNSQPEVILKYQLGKTCMCQFWLFYYYCSCFL